MANPFPRAPVQERADLIIYIRMDAPVPCRSFSSEDHITESDLMNALQQDRAIRLQMSDRDAHHLIIELLRRNFPGNSRQPRVLPYFPDSPMDYDDGW